MRTVKRITLPINAKKQFSLREISQAYSNEKQFWLHRFQAWSFQALLGRPRTIRNMMIKQEYKSHQGLQARHWKLALEDAAETWDKYWQAIFVKVRPKIARRKDLTETEQHYAYWLLKSYPSFAAMMQGKCPNPAFPIEKSAQRRVANYVLRLIRACKGRPPTVKISRSVRFDADCYEVFEEKERQYIKLMSLTPGKRICIPLSGKTAISGTITLVLSADNTFTLHIPQELKKKNPPKTSIEAVDFGYTEVMTDTQGIRYGTEFGTTLAKVSDDLSHKMKKRHKLHSLEKKQRICKLKQAKRLRKYNLGKKKQNSKSQRVKATLEKQINTSINQLIQTKNPSILVTENLRHNFTYFKSKKMNRRLSSWMRGKLQDRIEFKALAEGFRHEQVNPAYGSQSCPYCEFVDQGNRRGDRFQCLHCKHENTADRIAALNYARRLNDPEIGLYTPYSQVKIILQGRFHRRVEMEETPDCSGQDSRNRNRDVSTVPIKTENVIAGRGESRKNRTVNQRAKQKEYV
ncbi:MAG: zinc ribbon domain-containing protein [Rhabdochlamydiaceae bacterium]|jgi:IS605 OrfB family transposase